MSPNPNNTAAFLRLNEEMDASSGQLRYDPISSNLFFDLPDADKEVIRCTVLKRLETNDERIVSFAFKIGDLKIVDYIHSELKNGSRPIHWVITATYCMFQKTKDFKWLNNLVDLICDDNIPVSTRRLAFSYVANEQLDDNMKENLLDLYSRVIDTPLKIRLAKKLEI